MKRKADDLNYILTPLDEGMSIRAILKNRLWMSSRLMRKVRDQNKVFINGNPVRMNEKGKAGDCLTVGIPDEISCFDPEPVPFSVIFEDEHLLIINKEAGYVVHPTKGHPSNTVANGIMHYMLSKGDSYKIRFINRLDMHTSGILLIGKNSYCQESFTRQAQKGRVLKKYSALVKGWMESEEGVIDLPIGRPGMDSIQRKVTEKGYDSVTRYRVIRRFAKPYTLMELILETGRTHQIRVHMAHIGHPVAGDSLYGQEECLILRQALHASQLDFDHPASGDRISVSAPLPKDMEKVIRMLM